MKQTLVISSDRDCRIEVTHRDSDPGMWIVRRWKNGLWFKKQVSSDWFTDREQAVAFARALKIDAAMSEGFNAVRDGPEATGNFGEG